MEELVAKRSANRTAAIVAVVLLVLGLVGFFVLQGRHGREMNDLRAESSPDRDRPGHGRDQDPGDHDIRRRSPPQARDARRPAGRDRPRPPRRRRDGGDRSGEVVATTDQRQAGRQMDDEASQAALAVNEVTATETQPTPGQIEVAAPLFVGPERIDTVRVFVELGEFTPLPASK